MTWGRLLWWVLLLSAACCWCESVSGRPVSEDLRWRAVLLHEDDGLAYAKIAALLRLSESTLYSRVSLTPFKAMRIQRVNLFLSASLLNFLACVLSTVRAGNRQKGRLSALRAHTKAPYKMDFHREKLRNAKGA